MKVIVIITSITLAVLLGSVHKPYKQLAVWKKYIVVFSMLIASVITLYPPVAGTFSNLIELNKYSSDYEMPVLVKFSDKSLVGSDLGNVLFSQNGKSIYFKNQIPSNIKPGESYVLNLTYNSQKSMFEYKSTVASNPIITIPFIPSLENKIKILNFHVPVAWVSVLAYLISMINAVLYLRKKDIKYDIYAVSSAALGTMFTILATVTGMIWAKFNWGSFWNWDPRETSIFILLLIYAAYFALRSAIDKEELRAKISAVYGIIAFISVPFFVFVMPRITSGLHPGASGDSAGGPVLSNSPGMLDSYLLLGFGAGMFAFSLLYFWMYNLTVRANLLKYKIED